MIASFDRNVLGHHLEQEGILLLEEGLLHAARPTLEAAAEAFAGASNLGAEAKVRLLLAEAARRQGDRDACAAELAKASDAATLAGDGATAAVADDATLSAMARRCPVKLHIVWTDASGSGGVGVVLDKPDATRVEISHPIPPTTSLRAELLGAVIALEASLEVGAEAMELRTDCEAVVVALTSGVLPVCQDSDNRARRELRLELRPIIAAARTLIGRFSSFSVVHVARSLNRRADRLAARAVDTRQPLLSVRSPWRPSDGSLGIGALHAALAAASARHHSAPTSHHQAVA